MTNPDDIKEIIKKIKQKRESWKLSPRRKNIQTLAMLGIVENIALDEIYDKITWRDYHSGPSLDNHNPPVPGNIWVFGLTLSGTDCYLKFQDKPSGTIMWISLHEQERPLNLPYNN